MIDIQNRNQRLKNFVHDQVRQSLLKIGRKMVVENGPKFLTARKLSQASNTSIGLIYNIFGTMDNFVASINVQTLDDIYNELSAIIKEDNPYANLNRYADVFTSYVLNNRNLWLLLYQDLLANTETSLIGSYRKRIFKFEKLIELQLIKMFGELNYAERQITTQVLGLALFSLSGFVAAGKNTTLRKINKNNLCKLLLNTYLAGLVNLKKK